LSVGGSVEPGAAAYNAAFIGNMTTTVRSQTARMSTADDHSLTRYRDGVFQPVTSAPMEPTRVVSETGKKNSPVVTGK